MRHRKHRSRSTQPGAPIGQRGSPMPAAASERDSGSGGQPRSEVVQHARSLRLHGFERNRVLISVLAFYGLEDWVVSIRAASNFMEAAVTKKFYERFLI